MLAQLNDCIGGLKILETVIFVDFVGCGYIKTCHVDGADYSLAQFETSRFL